MSQPYPDPIYALALALTTGIGWKLTRRLLDQFGSLAAIFSASAADLQDVHGIGEKLSTNIKSSNLDLENIQHLWEKFNNEHYRILLWTDEHYPVVFHNLEDKPLVLFWRGETFRPEAFSPQRSIAIVGTREPTDDSAQRAQQWAAFFAEQGWMVISGLARGIDTQAHFGALAGKGRTLAFIGCGVNRLYPPENGVLASRILGSGGIISEVHPDTHVSPNALILRNRLITGLSQATIVMETGTDGGAMDAARRANKQGRSVFAPDNSPGNNQLLETFARPLPATPQALLTILEDQMPTQRHSSLP